MAAPASQGLTVEIRTPEGDVFSGDAVKVTRVPGSKGNMGILPRHAPLMSSLEVGVASVVDKAGTEWCFVTGEGFLEVLDNHVLVLVDSAEDITEIDVSRAQAAAKRASERLAKPSSSLDRGRAEAALARASMRIRFARPS
ncbi:MAG: ATP synthase F1 subunit epsilon [Planctomycetota bacterium]|nr:MAG: ATP synthase F1 subunit epsilon [Planctomycetota bacterium]